MRIHDCRILSLKEYVELEEPEAERPAACPGCGSSDCFWRNGGYWREVQEKELIRPVRVPRFMCRFCRLVVSVLLGFLVPYRRYSGPVVAEGVEAYLSRPTTYRELAAEVTQEDGDEPPRPSHSRIFQWLDEFSRTAKESLGVRLNRACVREGKERGLGYSVECPNALKAHSIDKARRLNVAATVKQEGTVMIGQSRVLELLRAYFLEVFQNPFDIFRGRRLSLSASQNPEHVF
jgi:hypothetical protein